MTWRDMYYSSIGTLPTVRLSHIAYAWFTHPRCGSGNMKSRPSKQRGAVE